MNITNLYNHYNGEVEGIQQINQFVADGLIYIIKNYFSLWSSYIVLTVCCRNKSTCNFYNDISYKVFSEWQEWPVQIVVAHGEKFKRVPDRRQYNMIFIDSYESMLETQIHTYVEESNSNERFFIFLQASDHLLESEMQKIFEYCWQHFMINCIVQVQKSNGQVLIYTYYPFTTKGCRQVETVLINEFKGTALVNEELFPNKLKNFHGCPIKAAMFNSPPFLYLKKDLNNITIVTGGIEGQLILELSKKLNFSLDIITSFDVRGEVYENGIITGSLVWLKNRKVDLCLGSFRQTVVRSIVATSTVSYFHTVWSTVTLSDAFILTSWETITFPFNATVWYLLAFMIILCMGSTAALKLIIQKKIKLNRRSDHIVLDVIVTALGMAPQYTPIYNANRIMQQSWIVFSLIIRTMYQALLYHLIRTHIRRNIPRSLEELVKQNYTLVVDTMSVDTMIQIALFNSTGFIYLESDGDFDSLKYVERQPLNRAKHMAVTLPIAYYKYYTCKWKRAGKFEIIPEHIMNFRMSMYLTKHSFLTEQFDEILKLLNDCGILNGWYHQEIDENYVSSKHIIANYIFGLEKLRIVFALLLIGYLIAILVFILELIYKRFSLQASRRCLKKY